MKKIISTILTVAILLVAFLTIAPSLINWSKYKPLLINKVQAETGYSLAIDGDLDMQLLPSPHLVVSGLTVAAPGSATPLLTLDRADIAVALLPLLKKQIVINSVALMKPQLALTINANGQPSWMTPKIREHLNGGGAGVHGPAANGIALQQIYIKGASLLYADKRSGASYGLADLDMNIHGGALSGPYDAQGSATYHGKPVKFSFKTGAVTAGAESVSLDATASVTGVANVTFAGVLGLSAMHDVQGEMTLSAPSLMSLVDFAGGKASPSLDKPIKLRGMISASNASIGAGSLNGTFGNFSFTGNFSLHNFSGGTAPLQASVTLTASHPVDIAILLPTPTTPAPAPVKATKTAPSKTKTVQEMPADNTEAPASLVSFIPATLTLPRPVDLTVTLGAPSVKYNTLTLNGVAFTASLKGQHGEGALKAVLPAGGDVAGGFTLDYNSMSQGKGGGLTLADPLFKWQANFRTSDGAAALAAFLPTNLPPAARSGLKGPLMFQGQGGIKGRTINIEQGALTILGTDFTGSGAFTPAPDKGRAAIVVNANADKLDLDEWEAHLSSGTPMPAPVVTSAPAQKGAIVPPSPSVIRDTAKSLILPFDLDVAFTANKVHWKNTDYSKVNVIASLHNTALNLKTLQAGDPDGNSILAAGTVGDLSTLKDFDISLQGKTPDLRAILIGVDTKYRTLPDSLKDASLVAEVKGQAAEASFTGNLRGMGGSLDTTGTVDNLLDKPAITALTLRLKHPSFVDVARLFNPDFSASVAIKKQLDIFASVKRTGNVYTLSDLQADIGPATIAGDVTADVSGAKPIVKAKLEATDVPLDDLIGHAGKNGHGNMATPLPNVAAQQAVDDAVNGHWSREPINAAWMRNLDVDLSASIKSLSYGTWKLDNGIVEAGLKDGTWTLSKLTGAMDGGQVSLTGKLTAPTQSPGALTMEGKADLEGVSLEAFMNSFAASKVVTAHGTLNVSADVQTSGDSPKTMIAGLGGKGTTTGKNIVFDGFDLARFSRTLVTPSSSIKKDMSSLLDATMQGGSTSFDTLDGAFTIAKGVVTLNPLKLTGTAATVSSPGTIDLPLWRIDMESTIQLAQPTDAPPLKVAIKGPLDQPAKEFGKSALDAYLGTKVQSLLTKALGGNGLGKNAATALPDGASSAPAAGNATPLKPKDMFKDMLKQIQQAQ